MGPTHPLQIVSGGQSGVDRAALDVALELGAPCGGWCPLGRRAEDGRLAERYPLRETPTADYTQRTHWNVRDSDGTLILTRGEPSGGTALTARLARRLGRPLLVIDLHALQRGDNLATDGSSAMCEDQVSTLPRPSSDAPAEPRSGLDGRQRCLPFSSSGPAQSDAPGRRSASRGSRQQALAWLARHRIQVLNVAGPRHSGAPGIYEQARAFLRELLAELAADTDDTADTATRDANR